MVKRQSAERHLAADATKLDIWDRDSLWIIILAFFLFWPFLFAYKGFIKLLKYSYNKYIHNVLDWFRCCVREAITVFYVLMIRMCNSYCSVENCLSSWKYKKIIRKNISFIRLSGFDAFTAKEASQKMFSSWFWHAPIYFVLFVLENVMQLLVELKDKWD